MQRDTLIKPYDFLVVGAGLFGSIFAQQAYEKGYRTLVIDERAHLGGNCYTSLQEGIHVHRYGAHLFHTSNEVVWKYLNRFTKFLPYHHRVKALFRNKLYSFPINLGTLQEIWGISDPKKAERKLASEKVPCEKPGNLEEWILSQVGPTLYEMFIKGYTQKQWQMEPKYLPISIIKRLPIRSTFDDSYFDDLYQGIPENGYTAMFEKMLEGIEVRLNSNFFDHRHSWEKLANHIVYTGRIDAFFGYVEGELSYRTLRFESTWHKSINVQGVSVINACDKDIPYTRTIEHRHFDKRCSSKFSILTKEYPMVWSRQAIPYYPINTTKNQEILKKYQNRAKSLKHVHFGGRLAEYKYYDMHHVVASALGKSHQWLHEYEKTAKKISF